MWTHGHPSSCVRVNPTAGSFKATEEVCAGRKQGLVTVGCFPLMVPVSIPSLRLTRFSFSSPWPPATVALRFMVLNLEPEDWVQYLALLCFNCSLCPSVCSSVKRDHWCSVGMQRSGQCFTFLFF